MMLNKDSRSLRLAMLAPLALLMASILACALGYADAKAKINADLNQALEAFAKENGGLLCQPDTISAIQSMNKAMEQPVCFRATDFKFSIAELADNAFYTISIANASKCHGNHFIESDTILIYDRSIDANAAIELKAFVDCSTAAIFSIADKTLPGILLALSMASTLCIWSHEKRKPLPVGTQEITPSYEGIKLTPMQRQLVDLILSSPAQRASKRDICAALWGNKDNAEESLYTLVRRTKQALTDANFEISCNRGDSYEIRIKS